MEHLVLLADAAGAPRGVGEDDGVAGGEVHQVGGELVHRDGLEGDALFRRARGEELAGPQPAAAVADVVHVQDRPCLDEGERLAGVVVGDGVGRTGGAESVVAGGRRGRVLPADGGGDAVGVEGARNW